MKPAKAIEQLKQLDPDDEIVIRWISASQLVSCLPTTKVWSCTEDVLNEIVKEIDEDMLTGADDGDEVINEVEERIKDRLMQIVKKAFPTDEWEHSKCFDTHEWAFANKLEHEMYINKLVFTMTEKTESLCDIDVKVKEIILNLIQEKREKEKEQKRAGWF